MVNDWPGLSVESLEAKCDGNSDWKIAGATRTIRDCFSLIENANGSADGVAIGLNLQ